MSVLRTLAPAKVNLGLFLGPVRGRDGRHELVSVMQSISLADELTLERRARRGARADEVVCPGVPGAPQENLAARALRGLPRGHRLGCPAACACRSTSASPSPRGSAAARPMRRRRCGWRGRLGARRRGRCCASSPASSAPTCPRRCRRGAGSPAGAGEPLQRARRPPGAFGLLVLPFAAGPLHGGRLRARRTGSGARALRRARAARASRVGRSGAGAALPAAARAARATTSSGRGLAVPGDRRRAARGRARRAPTHVRERLGADGARPVRAPAPTALERARARRGARARSRALRASRRRSAGRCSASVRPPTARRRRLARRPVRNNRR